MPFAVSQWPNSPDPRTAQYAITGWNFGQVPPFRWILSTTGATGALAIFNSGVVLTNDFFNLTLASFRELGTLPDDLTVIMNIIGTQEPAAGPPPFTIDIQFTVFQITATLADGRLRLLFPTAIAVQGPIPVTDTSPPGMSWPNDAEITPAKWNFE